MGSRGEGWGCARARGEFCGWEDEDLSSEEKLGGSGEACLVGDPGMSGRAATLAGDRCSSSSCSWHFLRVMRQLVTWGLWMPGSS